MEVGFALIFLRPTPCPSGIPLPKEGGRTVRCILQSLYNKSRRCAFTIGKCFCKMEEKQVDAGALFPQHCTCYILIPSH